MKNLTINNCQNIAVVFEDCVTTCEIINCKKLQIQAQNSCGTYVVDKCDRTQLFLASGSCKGDNKVVVMSCMSTATTVTHDKGEDDQVEHGVPDQIKSVFNVDQAPVHEVVVPDAE